MHRVHELVRHAQHHRVCGNTLQVAAPPGGLVVVLLHAFHDDQPIGVGGQHGVAAAFSGLVPVGGGVAVAPAGGALGFVEQVGADHRAVARVAARQHGPVVDPALLGVVAVAGDVPHVLAEVVVSLRRVAVQDHAQADLAAVGDDLVHALDGGQPLQVGVLREVDAVGGHARAQHLVGEGQAQGVEAQALHLIEHGLVTARPQAVQRMVARLEAEPVHARDAHRVATGVHDLVAAGAEIAAVGSAASGAAGAARHDQAGVVDGHGGRRGAATGAAARSATRSAAGATAGPSTGGGTLQDDVRWQHAGHRAVHRAANLNGGASGDGGVVGGVRHHVVRAHVACDTAVPQTGDVGAPVELQRPALQALRRGVGQLEGSLAATVPLIGVGKRVRDGGGSGEQKAGDSFAETLHMRFLPSQI